VPTAGKGATYVLRAWEADLARRELRAHGTLIPLGNRSIAIVEILLEAGGSLVTKDALTARVWPGMIVGDNTLAVHMSAIRKALGADRDLLRTDFGRGYRLLGAWQRRGGGVAPAPAEQEQADAVALQAPQSNLPAPTEALVGRDTSLRRLDELLSAYRVVTLTGPGGIGKTSLALALAHRSLSRFRDGVWLVELASLSDFDRIPAAVAGALELASNGDAITAMSIASAIGGKTILLLLDNCEHVIDAVAGLAEATVARCPGLSIVATGREPLRIDGEAVYRVPSLEVPPEHAAPETIGQFGAVQLFVARMRAQGTDPSLDGGHLRAIAAICRHLDGIPLAIELAAALAATLGVPYVTTALDDRFRLLVSGRRTALPRQQTLRATLDWSHDLLTAGEQMTLRRIATFAGAFPLQAAEALAAGADLGRGDVAECLIGLVMKSMVSAEHVASAASYQLLETTRSYARSRLEAAGEADDWLRRHANYHLGLLQDGAAEREPDGSVRPSRQTRGLVDEVAAALEWAFSPRGDRAIGVALTLAAIPLWIRTSLLGECQRRVEQAIALLHTTSGAGSRDEMRLLIALATAMQNSTGPGSDTTRFWRRAAELAEQLRDQDFQLRTLWGLWIDCRNNGEHREALDVANRFQAIAATSNSPDDLLVADRMVGMSRFIVGDLAGARSHVERMLAHYGETSLTSHMVRFHFEQRAGGVFLLAMILALQGFPHRARSMIDYGVTEVVGTGHALQISVLLTQFACPVAFLIGDLVRLEGYVTRLLEQAEAHGLAAWSARGYCWQALLRIRQGETIAGIAALEIALQRYPGSGRAFQHVWLLGEFARAQAETGRHDEADRAIELALGRAAIGEETWCVPELLRIRGDVFLAMASPGQAEAAFGRSLELARRQGARSWELRTATSLAGLWSSQGRGPAARALLAPVVGYFADDELETGDLRAARTLLGMLDAAG